MEKPTPEQLKLHDEAVARGQMNYLDPETGYLVFTSLMLTRAGNCCGSGCRHCPWPLEEQRRAGRIGA
jgi:hypothetical protein